VPPHVEVYVDTKPVATVFAPVIAVHEVGGVTSTTKLACAVAGAVGDEAMVRTLRPETGNVTAHVDRPSQAVNRTPSSHQMAGYRPPQTLLNDAVPPTCISAAATGKILEQIEWSSTSACAVHEAVVEPWQVQAQLNPNAEKELTADGCPAAQRNAAGLVTESTPLAAPHAPAGTVAAGAKLRDVRLPAASCESVAVPALD